MNLTDPRQRLVSYAAAYAARTACPCEGHERALGVAWSELSDDERAEVEERYGDLVGPRQ
jgi:hypothetical protein